MRPGLLFAERDLDLDALGTGSPTLAADLGLERLYAAMARDDRYLDDVVRRVLPAGLSSAEAIRYRQASVQDALGAPDVVRELYALAVGAIESEHRVWGRSIRSAELILDRAAEVIGLFLDALRTLRRIAEANAGAFTSPGFLGFFARVASELDDAFLREAEDHVARLRDRTLHVGARLGPGNRGTGYVLHRRPEVVGRWRDRVARDGRRGFKLEVLLRDQNAMNTLAELRSLAVAPTAGVVAEAAAHVLGFFRLLRAELGFLLGCVNLREALEATGSSVCLPEPVEGPEPAFTATGLVDPCLALAIGGPVVPNDVRADGKCLVLVTGANGGGKSTLLRAVGLAQVMLQAGMFVAADACRSGLRDNVLTHFTRQEDADLEHGRLNEELARLSSLIDEATPGSLVLLNESLSTTNVREGAEIARALVGALVDGGARVWFVTHIHQLAADLHRADPPWVLFLRAERGAGGERSFRIVEAAPQPTSHGMDIYRRIVGESRPPGASRVPGDHQGDHAGDHP